tara:strand:+ start:1660 stop:2109 length:450 start_codon:yes stop_codon:yes gene_type:complete
MGSFNGLIKAEFTPPRTWKLSRELTFRTNAISGEDIQTLQSIGVDCNSVGEIKVDSGFQTDLASVPRALWGVLSPWDIARAAVIHDQLYACCVKYFRSLDSSKTVHNKAREISDKVFLLAMNSAEPPIADWKKKAAYYAVRVFGKKHAK